MNKYKEKSGFINQVSSLHEPPDQPTSRKPTAIEALELKITLPWTGKVQVMTPDDLTPNLFGKLEEYGLFRQEIKQLFGFNFDADFYRWIHKNDIVSGGKTGPRGRQPNRKPKLATKPGQTQQQAINAAARLKPDPDPDNDLDKDLDAELAQVDQQLAAMGYGDAEQAAEAPREQVEEFFNDTEPACGGVASSGEPADALDWKKHFGEISDRYEAARAAESSGLAAHQDHYNACGPIQPIEAMQASMDPQRFIGKLQGDIIKYAMRAGKKGNELADVEKIIQYSTWWAQALRGETINPREGTK